MLKKFFISVIMVCSLFVYAQKEFKVKSFNALENELSRQWVSAVIQDKNDFIWAATQDGLYKYDGKNFKVFRYNPTYKNTLPANWVRIIKQDKEGVFWLGTQGAGLVRFDEGSSNFETIDIKTRDRTYKSRIVYNIIITTSSTLWVFSEDGLFRLSSNSTLFTKVATPLSPLVQIIEQNDGSEIAVFDNTLFKYNTETNVLDSLLTDIPFGRVLVTQTSNLIYRSNGKLYNYNFINEPLEIKTPNNDQIEFMSNIQDDKCILIGSQKSYTFSPSTNIFETYDYNIKNFKNLGINELFIDKQHLLWVATYKGLYKESLLEKAFTNQIDIHARRIIVDSTAIYIGGNDGLYKIPKNTPSEKPLLLTKSVITSVLKTKSKIWAGDYFGRIYIINKENKVKMIDLRKDQSMTIKIYGIVEDAKGRIWISTWKGIFVCNAEGTILNTYSLDETKTDKELKIIQLCIDKYDNLWALTIGDGLYRIPDISKIDITKNQFNYRHYIHNETDDRSINSNVVMEFHITKKGTIWIGSDFGINRYNKDEDNFSPFNINDIYFDKKVMAIETDDNNQMWISTINDGLFVYNSKTKSLFNLRDVDGLASNSCLFTSSTIYQNTLYFGTDEGVQIIDATKFNYPEVASSPKFTELIVEGKNPLRLQNLSQQDQQISIDYNKTNFSVSFALTDYRFPKKINYYYTLGDKNSTWIESEGNLVNFSNLKYGDYVLKVKAAYQANDDTPISVLPITINAPWYKSTWATLLFCAIIGIIIFSFLQLRYMQKLASNKFKSIKELDKVKSKLFTNISHELRTPLTLISGPVEHQLSKIDLNADDRAELNLVKKNADRLLNLINQLMDLAMIDSGQLKLKITKNNLNLLLKQAIAAFEYEAHKKQITVEATIEYLKTAWYDNDAIEKIVSNLLSNSIKYAPKNSTISFKANQKEGVLKLLIINDADVLQPDNLEQLFKRFHQNDASNEGVGVGLALVRELVTLHKGTIVANRIGDHQLQFTVNIPIQESAFSLSEITIEDEANIEINEGLIDNTKLPIVLIVEDDIDIRQFVSSIFKDQYEILEAENGKKGIDLTLKYLPDLIISDVMMPIIDGIELCEKLKNNELTSHIPIILLTAQTGKEHEIIGHKTGADAYISKPFSIDKLTTIVEKLIENRKQLQRHFSNEFIIQPELAITSTETKFLTRLKNIIEIHITNPEFSSERFAHEMTMSRTHLHRKLKAIVGMTTSEFIRAQRLKLAFELLQKSDATVSEIAYQVGFNTPSYFIKCFKEAYKCTPTDYISKK